MALGPKPTRKVLGSCELVAELHPSTLGTLWIGRAKVGSVLARRVPRGREPKPATVDALAAAADWAESVHHRGIVRVVGSEVDDDELVLLSALHEGEPLRSVLRLAGIMRRPLATAVALRIAADVVDALAHLHELDHDGEPALGALNPDNVLVCADGHTRLLEPGIWQIAARSAPWVKDAKRAAYDAPEALDGRGVAASDLFSVGVLVWEMLRNRPLFAGASYDAVATRVRSAAVRRVDTLKTAGGETIGSSVAEVVARALERSLDERFGSAAEMAAALAGEHLASHEEVAAALQGVAADMLARQRRKIDHALEAAPPARASAPSRAVPPPRKSAPQAAQRETPSPLAAEASPASARPTAPRISAAPRPGAKGKQRTLLGMAKLPAPRPPVAKVPEPPEDEPLDAEPVSDREPTVVKAAVVPIGEDAGEDVAFDTQPPPKAEEAAPQAEPDNKPKATPPPPPVRKGRKRPVEAKDDAPEPEAEEAPPPAKKAPPQKEKIAPARGFDMVSLAEEESLPHAPREAGSRRGMLVAMGIGVVAIVVVVIVLRNSGDETKTETPARSEPAAAAPPSETPPPAPPPPTEEKEDEPAGDYAAPSASPAPPPPPPAPVVKGPAPVYRPPPPKPPSPAPAPKSERFTPGGI